MKSFELVFIFIILAFIKIGDGVQIPVFIDWDELTTEVARKRFLYDENNGYLMLSGLIDPTNVSENINVYFLNGYVSNCTDDETKIDGVNSLIPQFDIEYCLGYESNCTEGLLICYDGELKKDYTDEKYVLKNVNEDVKCQQANQRGILVQTDASGDNFIVKTSIDSHTYKFPVLDKNGEEDTSRCFKIRMGTSKSLGAQITNMMNERLIFTGDPPLNFHDNFYYANQKATNFWQLFIDFMPVYTYQKYYFKGINYRGGGKNCNLRATFKGEAIGKCIFKTRQLLYCTGRENRTSHCEITVGQMDQKWQEDTVINSEEYHFRQNAEVGLQYNLKSGDPATDFFSTDLAFHYTHLWDWGKSEVVTRQKTGKQVDIATIEFKYSTEVKDGESVAIDTHQLMCMGKIYYMAHIGSSADANQSKRKEPTFDQRNNDKNNVKKNLTNEDDGNPNRKKGGNDDSQGDNAKSIKE